MGGVDDNRTPAAYYTFGYGQGDTLADKHVQQTGVLDALPTEFSQRLASITSDSGVRPKKYLYDMSVKERFTRSTSDWG